MHVLVTGGGGFLGRYIVEQLLAEGHQVKIFARGHYPELAALGVETLRGDIADGTAVTAACAGVGAVFHVAAKPGIWGSWDSYYRPNVLGTENVLTACRTHGISKLIYTSSPSVVFDNHDHCGVDASYPYPSEYETPYAHTKAMAEQMVLAANNEKLATVSLRPHLIWGPRDTQLLPRLLDRAKSGKLIIVGDACNKVDVSYVEDVARAHLLAATALKPGSPVAGKAYFISQNEPILLWPWINQLLRRLEIPPVQTRISLPVARKLGAMMEIVYRRLNLPGEPRLTRFLASQLALSHYYNTSAAERDFGFRPQFTMDRALNKTVAYLQREAQKAQEAAEQAA